MAPPSGGNPHGGRHHLALVSAGCSSDDDGGSTGASGQETGAAAVDVTLQEYAVLPGSSSTPAGDVTFNVTNTGPEDTHEFVVFLTDRAPDALPTNEDGTVDEEGEGVELHGEIEDITVGSTESLTLDLPAGNCVFICNIYEEDVQEAHYQEGMRVAFTVE